MPGSGADIPLHTFQIWRELSNAGPGGCRSEEIR
jgi:hypothetical protein